MLLLLLVRMHLLPPLLLTHAPAAALPRGRVPGAAHDHGICPAPAHVIMSPLAPLPATISDSGVALLNVIEFCSRHVLLLVSARVIMCLHLVTCLLLIHCLLLVLVLLCPC